MKLISINIERDLHRDLVRDFLIQEKPDVACLVELYKDDADKYAEILGMKYVFAPQCYFTSTLDGEKKLLGLGIFYRDELTFEEIYYYSGDKYLIPDFQRSKDLSLFPHILCSPVVVAKIRKEGKEFTVGAIHLPVTFHGTATEFQKYYAQKVLEYLKKFPEIILCGDFNAPRGLETFSYFSDVYKDNIPLEYTTSLTSLHKADPKQLESDATAGGFPGYMVDGLFTSNGFQATNVKLVGDISDHMAIVADIDIV